jgi:hypothetical protein
MNDEHGAAFNGMITLNFSQLGISGERAAARALTKMNEALADKIGRYSERWSYERPLPHYFLYAHEDVATSHGHHVHQLVVVPEGLGVGLDGWLKKWARRNFDGPHPDAVKYGGEYHHDLDERAKTQARMVSYIFKSSDDGPVRRPDGEPTTLLNVLKTHARRWHGDRAYCAGVKRVAGCSENIAYLAQIRRGFWGALCPEQVMNGEFLKGHYAAIGAREFTEMLRGIDV